jgi:hypothetical protein
MGIGFVIFIWLIFLGFIAASYLVLKLLSNHFHLAKVLKDALVALVLVGFFTICGLIFFNLVEMVVQNVYPTRIFTMDLEVKLTDDVEILDGGVNFVRSWLKFRANEQTIERIIEKRSFDKVEKKGFKSAFDNELKKLSTDENTTFYHSNRFASNCDPDNGNCHAYLVYNKQNGEAYFSW